MSKKNNAAPVNEIDETIKAGTSFIEKHFKTIASAIGGVLAVIIICLLVNQFYIQPNNANAADNIAVAQQHFQQGMYEQALNGDGTNIGFLQIIEQYGTDYGRLHCSPSYQHRRDHRPLPQLSHNHNNQAIPKGVLFHESPASPTDISGKIRMTLPSWRRKSAATFGTLTYHAIARTPSRKWPRP